MLKDLPGMLQYALIVFNMVIFYATMCIMQVNCLCTLLGFIFIFLFSVVKFLAIF
jgi:hypothetical protein